MYHVLDHIFTKNHEKWADRHFGACLNTLSNAWYIVNFKKKVVISFERGDIDVRPSHAKQQFFLTFSDVSRVWHTLLVLWSCITQVIINLWLHLTLFQFSCEDFKWGFEKVALDTLNLPLIDKRTKAYVRGCIYLHTLHNYILTDLHTYILAYLHTYILTYLNIYILTYLHIILT